MTRFGWFQAQDPYPLDTVPQATQAFSVARKLASTYSGAAYLAHKAGGGSTLEIGFSGLDVDTAALTAFLSGATGHLQVVHDQSGNGNDNTQATTAKQPHLAHAGAVITAGPQARPVAHFHGTDYLTRGDACGLTGAPGMDVVLVTQRTDATTAYRMACGWGSTGVGANSAVNCGQRSGTTVSMRHTAGYKEVGPSVDLSTTVRVVHHRRLAQDDIQNQQMRVDGGAWLPQTAVAYPTSLPALPDLQSAIGSQSNVAGGHYDGYILEMMMWATSGAAAAGTPALTEAQADSVVANCMRYYT